MSHQASQHLAKFEEVASLGPNVYIVLGPTRDCRENYVGMLSNSFLSKDLIMCKNVLFMFFIVFGMHSNHMVQNLVVVLQKFWL